MNRSNIVDTLVLRMLLSIAQVVELEVPDRSIYCTTVYCTSRVQSD